MSYLGDREGELSGYWIVGSNFNDGIDVVGTQEVGRWFAGSCTVYSGIHTYSRYFVVSVRSLIISLVIIT